MNFLGMGMFELAVIFLVAFLVLGPSKSIEMARTAGKVLGDLRRTFSEVIAATTLDPEHLLENIAAVLKGPLPASVYSEAKRRLVEARAV